MAKSVESTKINFGKRRRGKGQKRRGPKDKNISNYKGQGR
jgi:hypothetical protein